MATETARRGSRKWLWALGLFLLGASAIPIVYSIRTGNAASPPSASQKSQRPLNGVSCLGRIEPDGGVIHIALPYVLGRPPVVEALYVKEGAHVHRGTLLATVTGRSQLQAALGEAQAQTAVARRRLEQVKA